MNMTREVDITISTMRPDSLAERELIVEIVGFGEYANNPFRVCFGTRIGARL